jgi:hypothetical protein
MVLSESVSVVSFEKCWDSDQSRRAPQLGNLQHDFTETINAYSNGYQTHIHVNAPVISITGTGKVSKAKQAMDS